MHGIFEFYISFILIIFLTCTIKHGRAGRRQRVLLNLFGQKLKHINALECEFAHM